MCNPLIFLAVSAAATVAGKVQESRAQQRAANDNAADLEYQAAVDRDNAQAQARSIRRAGERDRGQALAGIAASGIKVGQGSALDVEREIMTDTETDARMAILNGERQARGATIQADNTRRAGRDARRAGYFGAATSLLSAGSGAYRQGMFGPANSGYDVRG